MTDKERVEEVERAIHQPLIAYLNDKISLFEATSQILNLHDSKDNKMIGILSEDQSSPFISLEQAAEHDASEPWCAGNFTDSLQAFGRKAQQDMLKSNFVRIIRRDE